MNELPDRIERPGVEKFSSMEALGLCLRDALAEDKDFYFFSPDETTSNKLSAVYEVTSRAWLGELKAWDKDMAVGGRVIELLSENVLFAMMAGHVLYGGRGAMASYEAFWPIVSSQLDQYIKFIQQASGMRWRDKVSALNLISTSTCWRQDHNGFSHQNPAMISSLLDKPSNLVNCLFPVDDVASVASWEFMSRTKDVVNFTTVNKTKEPRWIDINHARFQLTNGGASIFRFASDEEPDVVVVGAGDIVSKEALLGMEIVREKMPEVRMRFVGIGALSYGAIGTVENKLKQGDFEDYFTLDKPIVANFHGYAGTLGGILRNYTDGGRVYVNGFADKGSTTTPMDMLTRNGVSRWDVAGRIFDLRGREDLAEEMRKKIQENEEYARLCGIDTV